MLKMTNIEIKSITVSNMHLMIEKGIRGGKCEPIYYHAKGNNMSTQILITKKNHT